jgi:hypothetical protein
MRAYPLKRVFTFNKTRHLALTAQPEIRTVRELTGKVIGVNAPTDSMGISAKMILKRYGVDKSMGAGAGANASQKRF